MQVTVSVTVDLPASGDVDTLEPVVIEAGRRVMADALRQACKVYEDEVTACPGCGSEALQSEGRRRRVLLCSCGRLELQLKELRCEGCARRFRPAEPFLACLGGANATAKLRHACTLAGASWPYATAAAVLHDLCGATISPEWLRQATNTAGAAVMTEEVAAARALVSPTAAAVRSQREAARARPAMEATDVPPLLMVGFDGGWVPSRDQAGGMEGKVGVVASEVEAIGQGRRRLTKRRYVATFQDAERLGLLTYMAAHAVDGEEARAQVVVGDGANWIKRQAEMHFPRAVKILDWPHLERSVHKAIRAARPGEKHRHERRQCYQTVAAHLWRGDVDAALAVLTALRPGAHAEPVAALDEAITYLTEQRAWVSDYQVWRDEGYPVGSGMVERAVELVINRRLKRRGMRWRRPNATAVVTLRVRVLNTAWQATTHRPAA